MAAPGDAPVPLATALAERPMPATAIANPFAEDAPPVPAANACA